MKSKFAAAALASLLYMQGLLGFAAIASVLLKDRADVAASVDAATTPPVDPIIVAAVR